MSAHPFPVPSKLALAVALALAGPATQAAVDCSVTQATDSGTGNLAGTLSWAIMTANNGIAANNPYASHPGGGCLGNLITLTTDVTVTGVMKRLIDSNVTLQSDATRRTISGSNFYRPLFVKSGTVTITNVNLSNGMARGGTGNGGGGGAGLGGALFVYSGTVSVNNVAFSGNTAVGGRGAGATSGGAGGGGIFGNSQSSGGGGLFGDASSSSGGYGGTGAYSSPTRTGFGGGGFGSASGVGAASFGGGGGSGMQYLTYKSGKRIAFHGGGDGGFGGGGGFGWTTLLTKSNCFSQGGLYYPANCPGGYGGFGGGGGGFTGRAYINGVRAYGALLHGSLGGYGGGAGGYNVGGGGGAGFGGAIFVKQGILALQNVSFSNNSAVGGGGYTNGAGKGGAIFICTWTLDRDYTNGANGGCGVSAINETASYGVTFSGGVAAQGQPDLFWSGHGTAGITDGIDQPITFGPAPTLLVGGTGVVSATGGASGNPVIFSSQTTGVCTTSGTNASLVTALAVGTCTIAANQAGNANYNAAAQVTQTFSIADTQTIAFGAAPTLAVGGTGTVSATGGASGNPVTFASQTTGICTTGGTNGSLVTAVAAGTCTIAANQAGNANYNAAPQLTQTFNIGQGTQSIAFGAAPTLAVGGTGTVSATGGASGNPVTFTSQTTGVCTTGGANGSSIAAVGAGICTIAANQAGNANYNAAPQLTQTFSIGMGTQTIALGTLPQVRVGSTGLLSATGGASGNPVIFTSQTTGVCTTGGTNGSTLTAVAVGTCTIAANQAGNNDYNAAAQATQSYSVLPPFVDCSVTVATDDGTGTTAGTLSWAIVTANIGGPPMPTYPSGHPGGGCADNTITLKTDVTLQGVMLSLIDSSLILQSDATIRTISGNGSYRPLFVKSGSVTIRNLNLVNGKAKGGTGGGGGAGLGGALFVYDGTVAVESVGFTSNTAQGGQGLAGIKLGGGGMFGNGCKISGGGLYSGGGLFGDGLSGGYGGTGHYSTPAIIRGPVGGWAMGFGRSGFNVDSGFGGGGYGGAGYGGWGGFGGGGGNGSGYNPYTTKGSGGRGGFGGGGGGSIGGTSNGGQGFAYGYGGHGGVATGIGGAGGGGAGLGGAIFVKRGTLSLKAVSFTGNSAAGGTGANNGQGKGGALFVCTSDLDSFDCSGRIDETASAGVTFSSGVADGQPDLFWTGAGAGAHSAAGLTDALVISNQTIAFGTAPSITIGSTGTVSATGGTSGNPVSFTSQTPGICTTGGANGSLITAVAAGTCTIAANQAGNANYNAAVQVTQTFVIGKANQTITFRAAPTIEVGVTNFNNNWVSATGGASGNPVTFTSQTTGICTTNGGLVTGVAAGTCIIAADQAGNANYNAAAQVTQTFSIGMGTQTIAFGTVPRVPVGGSGVLSATGGTSGNPVIFASQTTGVCTTSGTNGSTIAAVAPGTCTIAANQAGNANYNAATQATVSLPVFPQDCSVTLGTDDGTGGTPGTLSWAIMTANNGATSATPYPSGHPGGGCVGNVITLKTDVTLGGVMKRLIDSDVTLQSDATTRTISGGNLYRPLFVKSGTVTISRLNLNNGKAKGGAGYHGGAGGGLGGALFVYGGTVTLANVGLAGNAAQGGDRGAGGWGGGGMFGNSVYGNFGGGGLFGDALASKAGGYGGYGGTGAYGGASGGFGGGGDRSHSSGGFGGGGGDLGRGDGGFGGGGGKDYMPTWPPSNGGFGGGGGGCSGNCVGTIAGLAGLGGFGAGAGKPGYGGYGAGGGGGGGGGLGGAIFVKRGTLSLKTVTFTGNSATAGTGANNGQGKGAALFICTADLDTDNTPKGAMGGCAGRIDETASYGVTFSGGVATDGQPDLFWTGAGGAAHSTAGIADAGVMGTQTIAFGAAPSLSVGGGGLVSATGGASGNPVTFTSQTTGVCTTGGTNGSTVTGVAAGICTIAADQAGNATYNAATLATQTFSIGKGAQTITFGAAPSVWVGRSGAISATGGGSGNPLTFSSQTAAVCATVGTNGGTVTGIAAGTCTIAADQAGNANYTAAAQASQSFTVDPFCQACLPSRGGWRAILKN